MMEVEFSHKMFTNFTNETYFDLIYMEQNVTNNRLLAGKDLQNYTVVVEKRLNLSKIFTTNNTNITIIPNDYRSIDEEYDASRLSLTWVPYYYHDRTLKIFLNITDPPEVSACKEGPDKIEVVFLNSSKNILFSTEL